MATSSDIRTALDRATRTVTMKPSVGQRVYTNTAVVEDGLTCRVQEKNHALIADLPPSMGGEDMGPSPSALLRGALSSCVAMGVKMWAARRGIELRRVEVCVETDVDARGQFGVCEDIPAGFGGVRVSIQVESSASAHDLQDVIDTSLRFSPLVDVFRRAHAIETHVSHQHCAMEDQ